jgi:hypothetical protein
VLGGIYSKGIFNGKRTQEAPDHRFKSSSLSITGKKEVDLYEGERWRVG